MEEPEAFGYCWHRNTGQWYYGVHLGDIDDNYAGSGTKFMELYGGGRKQDCYAPLDWHRTIEFRGTYKECDKWEEDMVTMEMIEHPLCINMQTGGGNGRPSKETRVKISAAMTGRQLSAEHCAKLSKPKMGNTHGKGYKHTAEALTKMSAAKKGKPKSAEHRAKISAANKGKTMSAEHRARLSAASKGKPKSAEHRAKISAAGEGNTNAKGYKHTAEQCAKMSAAGKERWRKVKEDKLNKQQNN